MLIEKETKAMLQRYLLQHSNLILLGDQGLGKRHIADQLAKELLKTDNLEVCPDYMAIQAESGSIATEQLDTLKNRTRFCAVNSPYKVFIIDDADTMNLHQQNALLKILEDGNATNIFIFVAQKPLLDTIHSRCMVIRIKNPSDAEIKEYFKGTEYDEVVMKLSSNRIGIYNSLLKDEDFVKDVKQIIHTFINMKNRREVFEVFGLIKEKDPNNFYEKYPIEKVQMFVNHMLDIFLDIINNCVGINVGGIYGSYLNDLSSRYEIEKLIDTIGVLQEHLERMKLKGKYSKNDFFDLIRLIAM